MIWIVKVALRAPYTFTVTGLLLLIGGILSGLQMAKDIFPAMISNRPGRVNPIDT